MKEFIATGFIIFSIIFGAYAQISSNDFVFKVNTFNAGESGTNTFEIPTHPDEIYNYDVDWNNDGVWDDLNVTGNITNQWLLPGMRTIRIRGLFPAINFFQTADPLRMGSIEQWGNNPWARMDYAFFGCEHLQLNATDNPNLDNVTTMDNMFCGCLDLIGDGIEDWNVSNVQSMESMFSRTQYFNKDISAWNMSNVTNISHMFFLTSFFNQNINAWDVSNVTEMNNVFDNSSFNQPLSNWDVSSVTNMSEMFLFATSFNQPLNNWDVSSVTNMAGMFAGAFAFNQPLNSWDVSSVTNMAEMFAVAYAFNQEIGSWDTGLVTQMSQMFSLSHSFNRDITGWDVSNVNNMKWMFESALSFNQNLGDWNVTSVGSMEDMFLDAPLSTSVYDAILLGWAAQGLQSQVVFGAYPNTYCGSVAARHVLVDDFGWIISDGGPECPPQIYLSMKVYLEGAYSTFTDLMYDVLRFNGNIPLIEPYTALGYVHVNGGGGEQTSQNIMDVVGQNAIVDWVFLEFRDPFYTDQILFTRSALVQRDGDIVDTSGNPDWLLSGMDNSVLTIVIRHRNHLNIKSELTLSDDNIYSVDFTDPSLNIFGTESRKTIGSKSYMYSGDPNGDGTINSIDKNLFWRNQNGQPYNYLNSSADMNLDGVINVSDKNNNWRPNNGNIEQLD